MWSQPKPLQKPYPPVMNAGGSPAAQDFTTRYCDMNFVILKDRTYLEGAKEQIETSKAWRARTAGKPGSGLTSTWCAGRPRRRPRTTCNYYVHEKGDWEAAGNLLKIFGCTTETLGRQDARRPQGAFHRRPRRLPAGRNG